jgi:hypothetical protein
MTQSVIPNFTPTEILDRLRGQIFYATRGYPETIQFKLVDGRGEVWWFATDYADYSPSDPDELLGRTIVSADLDEQALNLTIGFSDGSTFKAMFIPHEPLDPDLNTWTLFTPRGFCLTYGPGSQWEVGRGGDPV